MARFIIAQRLADQEYKAANVRSIFSNLRTNVAGFADVVGGTDHAEEDEPNTLIMEGDALDFDAKRKELPANFIIETEKLRRPGLFHPLASFPRNLEELPSGIGATIEVNASSAGMPLAGAQIVMLAFAFRGAFATSVFGVTDQNGRAILPYNPSAWMPFGVTVLPRSMAWPVFSRVFGSRMKLFLPALPHHGPLGWWHKALGLNKYSERLGEGIRVGVVDTGVGPHPYLSHVRSAGVFQNGKRRQSPGIEHDVAEHGTHVAGTIGARPDRDSGNFAGIAPGAELIAARVYQGGGPPTLEAGTATNGDIAQAILTLARDEECDIINLSSGGPRRSEIEADRIMAALNLGSLVICSVGNGSGPPVLFPAAEPAAIGVSAIGLTGGVPFGVLDILSYPMQPDRFSAAGAFAPSFISFGAETKCTGPGVGIVSTVPARTPGELPYMAMSGTSMAAPAVAGALAAMLSQDPGYRALPRTRQRSFFAWKVLMRAIRSLGLFPQYQGYGMPVMQAL